MHIFIIFFMYISIICCITLTIYVYILIKNELGQLRFIIKMTFNFQNELLFEVFKILFNIKMLFNVNKLKIN